MKKKLKGVDILYMVLLGLCVIMVGIVIGKTRLYDMWNEELICNILHLQQEEQIAEDRHMMEKIQTKILYYTLPQLPDDRMSLYGYVRNANVTIIKIITSYINLRKLKKRMDGISRTQEIT